MSARSRAAGLREKQARDGAPGVERGAGELLALGAEGGEIHAQRVAGGRIEGASTAAVPLPVALGELVGDFLGREDRRRGGVHHAQRVIAARVAAGALGQEVVGAAGGKAQRELRLRHGAIAGAGAGEAAASEPVVETRSKR